MWSFLVILSPYGLCGFLTGQCYKESDPSIQRLLNEWKQLYPTVPLTVAHEKENISPQPSQACADLSDNSNMSNSSQVACMLEVVVAGFRMKYPSAFVYLTAIDESTDIKEKTTTDGINATCRLIDTSERHENFPWQSKPQLMPSHSQKPTPTFLVKTNVCHELNVLQTVSPKTEANNEQDASQSPLWNFSDPCCKLNCGCFRCKLKKGTKVNSSSVSSLQGNNSVFNKKEKLEKERQLQKSGAKISVPFHRRSSFFETKFDVGALENSSSTSSNETNNASSSNANSSNAIASCANSQTSALPTYSYKSPMGGGLPSLPSSVATPTGIDSPASVAPHLLDPPSSVGGDQTSTSFSPNPKDDSMSGSGIEAQIAAANIEQSPMPNNKEKTHLEQLLSPSHSLPSVKGVNSTALAAEYSPSVGGSQWTPGAQSFSDTDSVPVTAPTSVTANITSSSNCGVTISPTVTLSNTNSNQAQSHPQLSGVKRPALAISSYEETDIDFFQNSTLYDYSHLNDSVLSGYEDIRPHKNRRSLNYWSDGRRGASEYYLKRNNLPTLTDVNDLQSVNKNKDPYAFEEDDEDFGSRNHNEMHKDEIVNGVATSKDFQQLSDMTVGVNIGYQVGDNAKAGFVHNEHAVSSPQTPRVFTREEELAVSYRDLDQIFESSEDSNDETFQTPLTPSAAKNNSINANSQPTCNNSEEHQKSNGKSTTERSILSVAELTRMFPTPPSLEPMAPSPCNAYSGPDITGDDISKCDIYPYSPMSLENQKVGLI